MAFTWNRVRQYIDTAGQGVIHAYMILRMGKNGLTLGVGYVCGSLDDTRIHIYNWFVAHECAGKKLDAVQAELHVLLGHLFRFRRTAGFRQLHLRRKVDGMAVLGKDVAGHQDPRPGNLSGFNSSTKRQCVVWVGTEVPYRCEAPASKHLLHMRFDFVY